MENFFLFKILQNPGRKIIALSYIAFVLVFIGSIVTGIVISADMGYGSFDAILLGIVCGIVGGFILATLTALPMKAFGVIVEHCESKAEVPVLSKYQITSDNSTEA